jgi:tetratricopeptide (TPR) repeat protein
MLRGAILVAVVLLALTHAVRADESPKAIYERATAHFNLGRYQQAAEEYQKVYELHPDPVLLYNIAQAYRLAGDLDKAVFFYKSYVRLNPQASNRDEVDTRLKELTRALEEQKKAQRPPNGVESPAKPPTEGGTVAPPPAETTTPPSAETQPASQATTAPAPAPAEQRRTPIYKKWWLWTAVAGVVVVGVAVGVGVGLGTGASNFNPSLPDSGPGVKAAGLQVRF